MDKQKIIELFDKSASSYNTYTPIQDSSAKELFLALPLTSCRKAIDVGAGSGYLTEKVLKIAKEVVAVDLSSNMLKKCSKISPRIEVLNCDGEKLPSELKGDLIVSNFAIQWFSDVKGSVLKFFDHFSKEGGVLAIGYPIKGTFSQLMHTGKKESTVYPMLERGELADFLGREGDILYKHEFKKKLYFKNALETLQSIKKAGANYSVKKPLNPVQLKRLLLELEAQRESKGIPLTYEYEHFIIRI